MKQILYTSCLCSSETEEKLRKTSGKGIGLQAQKYHRLTTIGLARNNVQVTALSYFNGLTTSETAEDEDENDVHFRYVLNKNGKKCSRLQALFKSFRYAFGFFKKNENSAMICDVLNFSVSYGALLAAKFRRKKVIGIITDFPDFVFRKGSLVYYCTWHLIRHCDAYVVLTEQMKEKLSPKKQVIVQEGLVHIDDARIRNVLEEKHSPKRIVYAGTLQKKYGIELLVKGFQSAGIDNTELHIYGGGEYETELSEMNDPRIVYHGIAANKEIVKEERLCTLLVNPRPSNEEFTKYSFPSKNMEYMASGTPVLTSLLPGMPKEYLDYVYIIREETVEGIAEELKTIFKSEPSVLHQKGLEARNFVLNYKNNTYQTKKILDFIEQC